MVWYAASIISESAHACLVVTIIFVRISSSCRAEINGHWYATIDLTDSRFNSERAG